MAAYLRLGDVIYPNARKIDYNYAAGVDYIMSRLSFISEQDGTVDAAYQYLGLDTIAVEDYPQAGIEIACTFHRFGRVEYQAWEPDSGSGSILDQIAYVRDRDGNVTSALEETAGNALQSPGMDSVWTQVLLRRARPGEQLHPAALRRDGRDEHVGLVAVRLAGQQHPAKHRRQLQRRQRGNDDQQRRASAQLQPCRQHADVEQRRHGGLQRLGPAGRGGRTSGTVEQCEYDGTGRRVQVATPTTVEMDYYSGQQVIESDTAVTGSGTTRYQWIWSPRYIDAPICRDTLDSNGNVESPTTGRIYYVGDANYNVTAVVQYNPTAGAWQVVERYTYDPYGIVTIYKPDWSGTRTSSSVSNTILYAGETFDDSDRPVLRQPAITIRPWGGSSAKTR